MALGFSHPVVFKLPKGVTAKVDKNKIMLTSVGPRARSAQTAAKIRELRPPEPYKGKGVKYVEEVIKTQGRQGRRQAAASQAAEDRPRITDMHVDRSSTSRKKRHRSIRKRIEGTAERPRLAVFRSTRTSTRRSSTTCSSARWPSPPTCVAGQKAEPASKASATRRRAPSRSARRSPSSASEKGIDKVVFDRNGYMYHGRVSALADGAREAGPEVLSERNRNLMAINYEEVGELVDSVVFINRVAKVVKGGRRFSFSALVVVGDQRGYVGAGLGKANEVPEAIRKGTEQAKKNLFKIPLVGRHDPARGAGPLRRGRGAAASGQRRYRRHRRRRGAPGARGRGLQDILTKCIGTSNPHNVIHATIDALQQLRSPGRGGRARAASALDEVSGS